MQELIAKLAQELSQISTTSKDSIESYRLKFISGGLLAL